MANPVCTGARHVPALLSLALTSLFVGPVATAQETQNPAPATGQAPAPATGATPSPEGGLSLDLDVIAKQLDIARTDIQPSLGATVYDFGRQAI
jgi:hypothetical protein